MLKNQTPGRPSGPRTYVRTLSCRKDEIPGTGNAPRAQRTHAEEHDPEPGAAVVEIDLELARHVRTHRLGRHPPVREQHVL